MTKKFGLKKETIDGIHTILAKCAHIEKAILYGSRAMGNYKTGSDIDLTLIGNQLTGKDVSLIQRELDDSDLPYLFDISILTEIENLDLVDHINRVGKIFYKRRT